MKENRIAFEMRTENISAKNVERNNGKTTRDVLYVKVDGKCLARVRECAYLDKPAYRVFPISKNEMPDFVEKYKGIDFESFADAQDKLLEALKGAYKKTAPTSKAKTEPKAKAEPKTEPKTSTNDLNEVILKLAQAGQLEAIKILLG